jgi:hypothetical protein
LTEADLRKQLQHAIDAQRDADENLRRAAAVDERAEHHFQKCQRRLAEFLTLEGDIAANTLEALRCDASRLSPDLSEEMEQRLIERERTRTEAAAADHAVKVLLAERAEASAKAGDAAKTAKRVACAVLKQQRGRGDRHALPCFDARGRALGSTCWPVCVAGCCRA